MLLCASSAAVDCTVIQINTAKLMFHPIDIVQLMAAQPRCGRRDAKYPMIQQRSEQQVFLCMVFGVGLSVYLGIWVYFSTATLGS